MDAVRQGADVLFILLGAIMVLAMHSGFAFLELGTVREKNQVNALVKILTDFAASTLAYFFVGYGIVWSQRVATLSPLPLAVKPGSGFDASLIALVAVNVTGPAVVLAAGGCAANPSMYQELHGAPLWCEVAYPYSQGEGLMMGLAAGGRLRGGDHGRRQGQDRRSRDAVHGRNRVRAARRLVLQDARQRDAGRIGRTAALSRTRRRRGRARLGAADRVRAVERRQARIADVNSVLDLKR